MKQCCEVSKVSVQQCDTADKSDLSLIKGILDKYQNKAGSLISILQKAQEVYGFLPMDVMGKIAEETGIKEPIIYGVATFYTQFRLNPIGKYLIMLCKGTACHVNGAGAIEEAICDELKIADGETTQDKLFTLNNVACLGCCSLSPVMMINGETYAKLTPDKTRKILKDIRKNELADHGEVAS
jgi:NADH:ubiquinone oxidoreductase subunit E